MDGNISRALWIGVGILFFIAVVTLGIGLLDQGKAIADQQTDNLAKVQKQLAEAEFDAFDNQSVVGTQVLSCIKTFRDRADQISIRVTTYKGTQTYLNNAVISQEVVTLSTALSSSAIETSLKQARTETHDAYINPVATFDAQIRRDANGLISAIIFQQE